MVNLPLNLNYLSYNNISILFDISKHILHLNNVIDIENNKLLKVIKNYVS